MPVTWRPRLWSRTRPIKQATPPKRGSATKSMASVMLSRPSSMSTTATCRSFMSASADRRQYGQRINLGHGIAVAQHGFVGGKGRALHKGGGDVRRAFAKVIRQMAAQISHGAACWQRQFKFAAAVGLAQGAKKRNAYCHAISTSGKGGCR